MECWSNGVLECWNNGKIEWGLGEKDMGNRGRWKDGKGMQAPTQEGMATLDTE